MFTLHIELTKIESGKPLFMPYRERSEMISNGSLKAAIDKCEVDGWKVHSWSVTETLPYDEGYSDASSGKDSDTNPYPEHFWKHDEWWAGWNSYHESNS